jgi:putative FmdB family regulatory protein
MPTYDYECTRCGHTFDAFQSMSDDPLRKCPECGELSLRRLIGGGTGVIFKGSGFYATDNRPSAGKSATSSGSPAKEEASPVGGNGGGAKEADRRSATKNEKTAAATKSDT